ncbi:hypothetical protein AA14337_3231 [Acetobacter malorum DSM 14337]|uniref:Uncharacterized protein n=2 Tax=Acetobacter malorum TaxID=178901 RepID=A0ABQ0Q0D8_9PROT|nr:hypothetical protein AD930_02200 [Acetobacter malorum]GBQ86062.1 hypothetical protein AA14337_3231 [Acetobacter malorum DSM 14337]
MSSYQENLIPLEGGAKGFGASGSNGAYLGAFQLSSSALQDAGFKNSDGSWTQKAQSYGVSSDSDFLSTPEAQIAADTAYNAKNASYLQSDLGPSYSSYLNSTDKYSGTTLSSGALAYCSESLGASGCATYLKTGNISATALADNPSWQNGGWQKNMQKMSTTSLGDTVDATVTSSTTTDSNGNTESATTVSSMYCAPEVKAAMQSSSANMLNNWVKLAEMPGTGYTLVNGQSVLQAGGGMSSGDPGYVSDEGDMYNAGYAAVSCIKQILNTRPMLSTSSFSLSGLLQQLASAACNAMQTQFSNLTQPVNQSLYKTIDLDGVIPGLHPGSISVGASTSMTQSSGGMGDALLGDTSNTPARSWVFN